MLNSGLKENILATLAYYDVLDMPLTAEEVFKRLVNFRHLRVGHQESAPAKTNPAIIKEELGKLVFDKTAGSRDGFYFLFDREYLAPLRLKKEALAKAKWKKTVRAVRWLRAVPYIRAVFASGSLAISNTDELSDLDVLMVVKHGRIWLARFLATALMSLLGIRRRASDIIAPNKVCLNHYITDTSLLIPFKSIYNAQTYGNLIPVYIAGKSMRTGLIDKFKQANNWVLDYARDWNFENRAILKDGAGEFLAKIGEAVLNTGIGAWLENLARGYQSRRIAKNPATTETGGRVVFNEEQLEFHPKSIEASIIKKYNENLVRLGLPDLAIEHDSGLTH